MVEPESMTPVLTPTVDPQAKTMDFPDAMREVIGGKKVARVSWGDEDYCLVKEGWLTIFTKGKFYTWHVNDGDLEGQDWIIVKENN